MKDVMLGSHRDSWRRRAWIGAISGLVGGAAFAVLQELDLRVFRYPADDLMLLGGMFGQTESSSRSIGMGLHALNSAALGAVYGVTTTNVADLPGPAKGIIFALIENTVLYPAFLMEERHPLIKSGKLPSYRCRTAFIQETLRHIAFGAATGACFSWLRKRAT